jgi:N-glycosylase/DNA lyase
MDIEKFIQQYSIKDIKKLEQDDPQFLALRQSRNNITNKNPDLFLFLVLQCALVSYQIS